MAERRLPDLRTRIIYDTKDLARAEREVVGFSARVRQASQQAIGSVGGVLQAHNAQLRTFGRDATLYVSAPLIAAGAASVKLGNDFDRTFTRMQGLAGVTGDEVAGLKDNVLDLARETGRGPQELAEGLYFVASSGIEANQRVATLTASAKGAAIGLGETASVADAATSAINAYGDGNITAAEAVDVLVATAREGKAEADTLAPVFGRLLPLASTLGVSFDQVGGALAFITRNGATAEQAGTQVLGILQKLIRPTEQGREELEKYGLSYDQLRRVVREQGLLAGLQLVNEAFDGNSEAMGRVFEDSEGLVGVLALLRNGGQDAADVFDALATSSGSLDDAFALLQDDPDFKLKQAIADLQTSMVELGAALAPTVTAIASGAATIAEAFTAIPAPIRNALLGIVIAVGPVSSALGRVGENIDMLRRIARRGADALSGLSLAGGGLATVAGVAIAAGVGLAVDAMADARREAERLRAGIADLRSEAESTGRSFEEVALDKLARVLSGEDVPNIDEGLLPEWFNATAENVAELKAALTGNQEVFDQYLIDLTNSLGLGPATEVGEANYNIVLALQQLRAELLGARDQDERYTAAAAALGIVQNDVATGTNALAGAQGGLNDERQTGLGLLQEEVAAWGESIDAQLGLVDSQRQATRALEAHSAAQQTAIGQGPEIERQNERIADAARNVADAETEVADAKRDAQRAEEDLSAARQEAVERLDDLRLSAEGSQLSEERARLRLDEARRRVEEIRDDPRLTEEERAQQLAAAQLDLREADLALRQAVDANSDSQRELNDAQTAGVEGSPEVVAAKEAIIAANDRVAEANQRVIEAEAAVGEAIKERQRIQDEAAKKLPELADAAISAVATVASAVAQITGDVDAGIRTLMGLLSQIDPNSPLGQRIASLINSLNEVQVPATVTPGQRPTRDPDAPLRSSLKPRGLDSSVVRNPLAPVSLVRDPLGPEPRRRELIGAGAGAAPVVNQPITVQGAPDHVTLMRLERAAERGVQRGLEQAVRGL